MKLPKNFKTNYSLKKNNSLKVNYFCDYYTECKQIKDLFEIHNFIKKNQSQFWILGEGTNTIIKNDLRGLVIKNNLKEFSVYKNFLTVGAGEIWDVVVEKALKNNLYGLENLSGIPGLVGASPIQNIGAYGIEISNFISHVETFNFDEGHFEIFSNQACNFSYRRSIFKEKSNLMITKICLNLSKKFKANTQYDSLPEVNNAKEQRNNILNVRSKKLPDHLKIPNVGSFFKNPVISKSKKEKLLLEFVDMKIYLLDDKNYKISAAWLIEKAGLKGSQRGDCGISTEHALVFYNFSDQSDFLLSYAKEVKEVIKKKFEIDLEFEPSIIS